MAKRLTQVYQFYLAIAGSDPLIWRRCQVNTHYRFWDLHVAIQNCFQWQDTYPHAVKLDPATSDTPLWLGDPEEPGAWPDMHGTLDASPDWTVALSDHFPTVSSCKYVYGSAQHPWRLIVLYEATLPRHPLLQYPYCVDGEHAPPPEDIHGIQAYQACVAALLDPRHPDHDNARFTLGAQFDPTAFDPGALAFDRPRVNLLNRLAALKPSEAS